MQAIRNILELARTRLAGLPASAKLLAGSLAIIVALGLFLVAQWSARSESVAFAIVLFVLFNYFTIAFRG